MYYVFKRDDDADVYSAGPIVDILRFIEGTSIANGVSKTVTCPVKKLRDGVPRPGVELSDADVRSVDFLTAMVPVVSERFRQALVAAGATDVEAVPTVLKDYDTGRTWDGFWTLNAVGTVKAVACKAPKEGRIEVSRPAAGASDEGIPRPGDAVFGGCLLRKEAIGSLLAFRIESNSTHFVIHPSVKDALDDVVPPLKGVDYIPFDA